MFVLFFIQTFFDQSINDKSLPTALRKALVEKFPDFDEYQLGKYNKEKIKNKTKSIDVDKDEIYRQCQGDQENPKEEVIVLFFYHIKYSL